MNGSQMLTDQRTAKRVVSPMAMHLEKGTYHTPKNKPIVLRSFSYVYVRKLLDVGIRRHQVHLEESMIRAADVRHVWLMRKAGIVSAKTNHKYHNHE